jgi:hypothetical protein
MDSRKCQTATVTPAKPGDYLFYSPGRRRHAAAGGRDGADPADDDADDEQAPGAAQADGEVAQRDVDKPQIGRPGAPRRAGVWRAFSGANLLLGHPVF